MRFAACVMIVVTAPTWENVPPTRILPSGCTRIVFTWPIISGTNVESTVPLVWILTRFCSAELPEKLEKSPPTISLPSDCCATADTCPLVASVNVYRTAPFASSQTALSEVRALDPEFGSIAIALTGPLTLGANPVSTEPSMLNLLRYESGVPPNGLKDPPAISWPEYCCAGALPCPVGAEFAPAVNDEPVDPSVLRIATCVACV